MIQTNQFLTLVISETKNLLSMKKRNCPHINFTRRHEISAISFLCKSAHAIFFPISFYESGCLVYDSAEVNVSFKLSDFCEEENTIRISA